MLVLSVYGIRLKAIDIAPIVNKLAQNASIESVVAVTAQHRQMFDQLRNLFAIQPQYDLHIIQANQKFFHVPLREMLGLRNVY